MARLKVKYTEEVAPALFKKFGYKSTMQIPKIDKVVVNVGCGEARENAKAALVGFNTKICAALSADAAKRLALLGEVACGYQFDVSNF